MVWKKVSYLSPAGCTKRAKEIWPLYVKNIRLFFAEKTPYLPLYPLNVIGCYMKRNENEMRDRACFYLSR